jgi:hypothetical protein
MESTQGRIGLSSISPRGGGGQHGVSNFVSLHPYRIYIGLDNTNGYTRSR